MEKKYSFEKSRADKLEEEVVSLRTKVKVLEDGGQKLVQRQQLIASLRKQLKISEDVVQSKSIQIAELTKEFDTLRHNSEGYSSSQASLEASKHTIDELRRKLSQQHLEVEALRNELNSLRRQVQESNFQRSTALEVDSEKYGLKEELVKLKTENSRLRNELSAFDLEFFEEIENLKYAHSEALKKIKFYQQQGHKS